MEITPRICAVSTFQEILRYVWRSLSKLECNLQLHLQQPIALALVREKNQEKERNSVFRPRTLLSKCKQLLFATLDSQHLFTKWPKFCGPLFFFIRNGITFFSFLFPSSIPISSGATQHKPSLTPTKPLCLIPFSASSQQVVDTQEEKKKKEGTRLKMVNYDSISRPS